MSFATPLRRLRTICALAALAGCGHLTSVDNPGDHWQRVETQGFRIYTDARALHYKFVATRLEHIQKAIKQTFFPQLETPPLDVLFISDDSVFLGLVDNVDLSAMFVHGVGKEGVLVMREGEGEEDETTAGLGVASHLVRHAIPRAPAWMHLGFASFLETAVVRNDGVALFGQPPTGHAIEILEGRLVPLGQLERATWAQMNGPERRRHYATAWAFVHYMAVGGSAQVRHDLFAMLEQASTGDVDQALRLPITQYEEGFRDYALQTFASKPSVKVFVQRLGALSEPPMKVTAVPATAMRDLLQAVRAARAGH
jgi:hypothetical protein